MKFELNGEFIRLGDLLKAPDSPEPAVKQNKPSRMA